MEPSWGELKASEPKASEGINSAKAKCWGSGTVRIVAPWDTFPVWPIGGAQGLSLSQ